MHGYEHSQSVVHYHAIMIIMQHYSVPSIIQKNTNSTGNGYKEAQWKKLKLKKYIIPIVPVSRLAWPVSGAVWSSLQLAALPPPLSPPSWPFSSPPNQLWVSAAGLGRDSHSPPPAGSEDTHGNTHYITALLHGRTGNTIVTEVTQTHKLDLQ